MLDLLLDDTRNAPLDEIPCPRHNLCVRSSERLTDRSVLKLTRRPKGEVVLAGERRTANKADEIHGTFHREGYAGSFDRPLSVRRKTSTSKEPGSTGLAGLY